MGIDKLDDIDLEFVLALESNDKYMLVLIKNKLNSNQYAEMTDKLERMGLAKVTNKNPCDLFDRDIELS